MLATGKPTPGIILGDHEIGDRVVFYPMLGRTDELKKLKLEEVKISNDYAIYGNIILEAESVWVFAPIDDSVAEIIIHEVVNR